MFNIFNTKELMLPPCWLIYHFGGNVDLPKFSRTNAIFKQT